MLDSKALTKFQSIILIVIVAVVGVGGVAFVILNRENQSVETIKIGVFAYLDRPIGEHILQSTILAAEQLNAEGGILGRQVEVIGEDNGGGLDAVIASSALNRLITYHKVDFILGMGMSNTAFMIQETMAEHKKIFIMVSAGLEEDTQRVLDDYDKYKYYFRVTENVTSSLRGITDACMLLRENLGFNKIGVLVEDLGWAQGVMQGLEVFLPANGFDLVYKNAFPLDTVDFSSYFAAAEAAEVEVLIPMIASDSGIPFVKEYYDRQSPMFVYGVVANIGTPSGWEVTDGKCDNVATAGPPIVAGYPITSKTLPTRDAYRERWDADITGLGAQAYDALRFILSDAIERAGTIETEAVIKALEDTSLETSAAKNWVFTSSHDVMVGENVHDPDADYQLIIVFQWQNGQLMPIYPEKIMEEAGATYTYPDWPGPWD